MDWIQERNYVPDVAIMLDRDDRYVKWLFDKLKNVDVTRSVRRAVNEDSDSIPNEVEAGYEKVQSVVVSIFPNHLDLEVDAMDYVSVSV